MKRRRPQSLQRRLAGAALLALPLFLAACMWQIPLATPKQDQRYKNLTPPQDQALLYLIRIPQPNEGGSVGTRVFLDGAGFGTVIGGSYLVAALPPGQHQVFVQLHTATSLTLDMKAGQTYYVEQGMKVASGQFRVWLRQVDAAQGRKSLEKCRYSIKNEFGHTLP